MQKKVKSLLDNLSLVIPIRHTSSLDWKRVIIIIIIIIIIVIPRQGMELSGDGEGGEGVHKLSHSPAPGGQADNRADVSRVHITQPIQGQASVLQFVEDVWGERVPKLAERVLMRPQPQFE